MRRARQTLRKIESQLSRRNLLQRSRNNLLQLSRRNLLQLSRRNLLQLSRRNWLQQFQSALSCIRKRTWVKWRRGKRMEIKRICLLRKRLSR